jgi:hypothetical protein
MRRLQDRFAGRLSGVLVEPMIADGVETIVGVVQEPMFGPVVVFGLGGVATEVLGDRVARLAPLTIADADPDPLNPRRTRTARARASIRPTSARCATPCSGCRTWRTTCRWSPSWTSTR